MPKNIPLIGLEEIGILISAVEMDNGELRVRCMKKDGSGYILTEPPADWQPTWQNAHYHIGVLETYVVDRGEMAFAWVDHDGLMQCKIYKAGEVITSVTGVDHNVYLFAGASIHTIKHGTSVGNPEKGGADWYDADPAFDAWTKRLSEKDIRNLAS